MHSHSLIKTSIILNKFFLINYITSLGREVYGQMGKEGDAFKD